jgi:hypothetical protein
VKKNILVLMPGLFEFIYPDDGHDEKKAKLKEIVYW